MEKYVVSFELAKKLKELGVKQKSLFCWVEGQSEFDWEKGEYIKNKKVVTENDEFIFLDRICATFITDEIEPLLPLQIFDKFGVIINLKIEPTSSVNGRVYRCGYEKEEDSFACLFEETKLPDALAKTLMWCIKNGYVEVENENK